MRPRSNPRWESTLVPRSALGLRRLATARRRGGSFLRRFGYSFFPEVLSINQSVIHRARVGF